MGVDEAADGGDRAPGSLAPEDGGPAQDDVAVLAIESKEVACDVATENGRGRDSEDNKFDFTVEQFGTACVGPPLETSVIALGTEIGPKTELKLLWAKPG